ncbi:MAG TPA: glycosyltransferase family 2 protein [Anaerolineae bacterium]|nr:glycosyltransferase family 2 protein [Anaerolineae bacterium]
MSEIKPVHKLTIVIPVYNEQATIARVVERVCSIDLGDIQKEIVICDDGSTDATCAAVEELRKVHDQIVRVYTSPINLGKGAAVRLGMSFATGDAIIIQDADLELNPAEYVRMLRPILDGRADVVYGSRFLPRSNHIPLRTRLANRFLTLLTNLLFGAHLSDMETAYKVFRREVVAGMRLRCVRFDFEPEITARLLRAGHAIHEVPISYNPRTAEEGKKISWVDGIEAVYTLLRCRFEQEPPCHS